MRIVNFRRNFTGADLKPRAKFRHLPNGTTLKKNDNRFEISCSNLWEKEPIPKATSQNCVHRISEKQSQRNKPYGIEELWDGRTLFRVWS